MKIPAHRSSATFSSSFLKACVLVLGLLALIMFQPSSSDQQPYLPKYDSASLTTQLEKGKAELESIEKFAYRARVPRNGECWRSALDSLRISCAELTEEVQSRLALSFTSCFSQMVGLPNTLCGSKDPIPDCVRGLDDQGLHSFRQFFLHTMDMCYYIQSELWQIETDRAVNQLQLATVEMGKTVIEQKKTADSILSSQQLSQKVQENIMKENNVMLETVVKIKDVFTEFSHTASEHQAIFMEIFQKLTRMQELVTWIQGEMSLVDLVGFYFIALVFSYFATASERTQRARVWIVLTLAGCLFLERWVYGYLSYSQLNYSPEQILTTVWLFRKVASTLCMFILVVTASRYQDYNVINNTILADLKSQMVHVMDYMEKHSEKGDGRLSIRLNQDNELPEIELTADGDLLTSDSDTTYSNSSSTTPSRDPDSDKSDYSTPQLNLGSTLEGDPGFVKRISNLLRGSFIRTLKTDSPQHTSTPSESPGSSMNGSFDHDQTTELISPTAMSTSHGYNLRDRSRVTAHELKDPESPTQFVRSVQAARRNRRITTAAKKREAYFSSDEEFDT